MAQENTPEPDAPVDKNKPDELRFEEVDDDSPRAKEWGPQEEAKRGSNGSNGRSD